MASVDPNYPVFVLASCLIAKADYSERISPALQRLKFAYWGHDEQVLHEHEIRKPNKDYGFGASRASGPRGCRCLRSFFCAKRSRAQRACRVPVTSGRYRHDWPGCLAYHTHVARGHP